MSEFEVHVRVWRGRIMETFFSVCDYIRTEGDFHKEICNWKDQNGRDQTRRTDWENGELSGEFMEWNTVETAIKTE